MRLSFKILQNTGCIRTLKIHQTIQRDDEINLHQTFPQLTLYTIFVTCIENNFLVFLFSNKSMCPSFNINPIYTMTYLLIHMMTNIYK